MMPLTWQPPYRQCTTCDAEGAVCMNDRQHMGDLLGSLVLDVIHNIDLTQTTVLTIKCRRKCQDILLYNLQQYSTQ